MLLRYLEQIISSQKDTTPDSSTRENVNESSGRHIYAADVAVIIDQSVPSNDESSDDDQLVISKVLKKKKSSKTKKTAKKSRTSRKKTGGSSKSSPIEVDATQIPGAKEDDVQIIIF